MKGNAPDVPCERLNHILLVSVRMNCIKSDCCSTGSAVSKQSGVTAKNSEKREPLPRPARRDGPRATVAGKRNHEPWLRHKRSCVLPTTPWSLLFRGQKEVKKNPFLYVGFSKKCGWKGSNLTQGYFMDFYTWNKLQCIKTEGVGMEEQFWAYKRVIFLWCLWGDYLEFCLFLWKCSYRW